jgi:hypothetical protein
MAIDEYLGVVVRESLRDPSLIPPLVASRRGADWTMLLVRVPVEELDHGVAALRSNFEPTDCWYAHFFREEELVVVFADEVFRVSTDPATWDAQYSTAETAASPITSSTSHLGRSNRPRLRSACGYCSRETSTAHQRDIETSSIVSRPERHRRPTQLPNSWKQPAGAIEQTKHGPRKRALMRTPPTWRRSVTAPALDWERPQTARPRRRAAHRAIVPEQGCATTPRVLESNACARRRPNAPSSSDVARRPRYRRVRVFRI